MILQYQKYCEKCGESRGWCKPCQMNYLKENFTNNWTSGNERIDNFIQEMQLKVMKRYLNGYHIISLITLNK